MATEKAGIARHDEERTEMAEYEQSEIIDAGADEVFAWVSDVNNLPKYLPPIKEAQLEDGGERVWLKGEIPDRGEFDSEGYFRVDESSRRMEWGAEVSRDYSGWLTVADGSGGDSSEVTVHLNFGPRTVEGEIQEDSSEERDPLEEGVGATLESIKRQIEEGSGKVAPSSPEE